MTPEQLLKHLYTTGKSAFEYALELSQRDEWQDISTAPKDEKVLLYVLDDKWVVTGWYDTEKGWRACDSMGQRSVNTATHWKPISPPKGE